MYICVTIRTGTNKTSKMERIATMVNSLIRWLFCVGLRRSCFISYSCAADVIHLKTVFHSSSRETNVLFSFIITNCFNNCYTTFPWLPVSNILDFEFYCNGNIVSLWKSSEVKEIVLKSCVINFLAKWSFWLFYS